MPQRRKRRTHPGAARPLTRLFPLFPSYIFLPIAEARSRELFFCRGLKHPRHLLSDSEGHLWVAPAEAIFEIARAEHQDRYDETLAAGALRSDAANIFVAR